jgi:hypothetical protein
MREANICTGSSSGSPAETRDLCSRRNASRSFVTSGDPPPRSVVERMKLLEAWPKALPEQRFNWLVAVISFKTRCRCGRFRHVTKNRHPIRDRFEKIRKTGRPPVDHALGGRPVTRLVRLMPPWRGMLGAQFRLGAVVGAGVARSGRLIGHHDYFGSAQRCRGVAEQPIGRTGNGTDEYRTGVDDKFSIIYFWISIWLSCFEVRTECSAQPRLVAH